MSDHAQQKADYFDDRVANDPAFERAVALVVAARALWIGYHGFDGAIKIPTTMPRKVSKQLCDAVTSATVAYEQAVIAGRSLTKTATFAELEAYESSVKEARDLMRYRTNQLLMDLHLSVFTDWEGFTSIQGWKDDVEGRSG